MLIHDLSGRTSEWCLPSHHYPERYAKRVQIRTDVHANAPKLLGTRQWKQPTLPAKLPSESFFESFGTIIRYARNAPGFQVVLARNFLFALFISVIPALM